MSLYVHGGVYSGCQKKARVFGSRSWGVEVVREVVGSPTSPPHGFFSGGEVFLYLTSPLMGDPKPPQSPYKALFDTEKIDIAGKNLWFWNE